MKKIVTFFALTSLLLPIAFGQVRLAFRPLTDGFHFTNSFTTEIQNLGRTDGLCGGMALAAFNFFRYHVPIPNLRDADVDYNVTVNPLTLQTSGTTLLVDYIFQSQFATYLNPRSLAFFGPLDPIYEEEYGKVKSRIANGQYAILGLKMRPGIAGMGHQVLCYGYNDATSELYIYDSNFPDQEILLSHTTAGIVLKNTAGVTVSEKFKAVFEQQELFPTTVPGNTHYDLGVCLNQNLSVRPPAADLMKPVTKYINPGFDYAAKLPPQNVFKLQRLSTLKMMEVEDAAFSKGTKVQQFYNYERNGLCDGKNQQWLFIPSDSTSPERDFYIINYGFLKYLEAGADASLQNANENRNQKWSIQPSPIEGIYYIKSVASQTYLQLPSGSVNDGDKFTLGRFTGAPNQQFGVIRYVGITGPQNYRSGSFVSINSQLNPDKALNIADNSTSNGAVIQLYGEGGHTRNEHWQLDRTPDGYYKIKSRLGTNKIIDITGWTGGNNSNLTLWDNAEVEKQKWLIIPVVREPGSYVFFNKVSGRCMDIAGGHDNDHAAIQTYMFQNSGNQKWKILPVTE